METEIKGYLAEFNIIREQVRNAIKGLDDKAANWQPLPEGTNSIYAILTHVAGSESYWIHYFVGGGPLQRDREAEFRASGNFAELVRRWEAGGKETDKILGQLSDKRLVEPKILVTLRRPEPQTVNARWCILHMLNHLSVHVGHLELTRQLWEYQQGRK